MGLRSACGCNKFEGYITLPSNFRGWRGCRTVGNPMLACETLGHCRGGGGGDHLDTANRETETNIPRNAQNLR